MTIINARDYDWQGLNQAVRDCDDDITIKNCIGERFVACGAAEKKITIEGIAGNALGAYLNGSEVECFGSVQDAVGDTMDSGKIISHGDAGDALGYGMRGGEIYIKGNAGYRTGIHMKQYLEKRPLIVVGGKTGSFLGEYMAGGVIVVLGLTTDEFPTGAFTGTGIHGGEIWIRSDAKPSYMAEQVSVERVDKDEISAIMPYIEEYSKLFSVDVKDILNKGFYKLSPNANSPYKKLYTANF